MGLQILINEENKGIKKGNNLKVNWEAIPEDIFYSKLSGDSIKLYGLLGSQITKKSILEHHDTRAFPSFGKINEWTGWNNRKIGKLVNELVEAGWIKNIVNPMKFNFQSNYYLNVIPEINPALIKKRKKRHQNMSKATKDRLESKKKVNSG